MDGRRCLHWSRCGATWAPYSKRRMVTGTEAQPWKPHGFIGDAIRRARYWRGWLPCVLLLVGVTALNLFSLLRTPAPFVDDAWFASRAWALIHTGRAFSTLDMGVSSYFPGAWTTIPWLGTLLQAIGIRVFGLSLWSIRLGSLVFGLILLLAVYAIANRLGGRRMAVLAMLSTSTSTAFLLSSHLGRPDILVAAFGFCAIALYVTDESSTWSLKSVLSGLLATLAVEIHPNGMIYVPTILALYFLSLRGSLVRARRLYGFLLGAAAGILFYLAMHVLPYPQTYLSLNSLIYGPTHTPPILVANPRVWLESLNDTLVQAVAQNGLRLPLMAAALLGLLRRRAKTDRTIVGLWVALTLAFAELVRNKHPFYAILASPASDLLVAVWLEKLITDSAVIAARRRAFAWAGLALLGTATLVLLAVSASQSLVVICDDPMDDFRTALRGVREAIPPSATVMGPQTYWFATPYQVYLSWEQLVYYRRWVPGSDLVDALRTLHPGYLIIDRDMQSFAIADEKAQLSGYGQNLWLPKVELDAFLAERGTLVRVIGTSTFGSIRIYRVSW